MPHRCVVGGCSNTYKNNVSFHYFPKNETISNKWNRAIRISRKDWKKNSKYSVVCSQHFKGEDFEERSNIAASFGLKMKIRLKPDAVPSVFPNIHNLSGNINPSDVPSSDLSESTHTVYLTNEPEYSRPAYKKRALKGVCEELLAQADEMDETATNDIIPQMEASQDESHRTIETYCNIKPYVRSCKIQVDPKTKEKSVQADNCNCCKKASLVDVSTQTEYTWPVISTPVNSDSEEVENKENSDYTPSDSSNSFNYNSPQKGEILHNNSNNPISDRIFLVKEKSLLDLFSTCRSCYEKTNHFILIQGCYVKIKQICESCGFIFEWENSDFLKDTPTVNFLLSCSILFSGNCPRKAIRMFMYLNIPVIAYRTYMRHQNLYLQPTVFYCWKTQQNMLIDEIKQRPMNYVIAGGDGRCDSPGYCAKYCSYTLMDLETNKILDLELIQSNEVANSCAMEKEGLIRCLNFLDKENIQIKTIVTDRHTQIRKYLQDTLPETKHQFDVWHIAKSLNKKLTALGKQKECEIINEWRKSIINHLYWCAASSDGDPDLVEAKWLSLLQHIQNIHENHGEKFKKCLHPPIITSNSRTKWLKPHTKPTEKLTEILLSKSLLKDARMMSVDYQTSCVESFHAILNHFCPKLTGFSYVGMNCRLLLAAMHFNENYKNSQAKTKFGESRFDIVFPKYKQGQFSVKPINEAATFHYVKSLIETAVKKCAGTISMSNCVPTNLPPPLTSKFLKPDKKEVINTYTSRYNHVP